MNIQDAAKKIRFFYHQNKRLPSYREMAELFGFASKKASFDLAKKMIEAGILEKDESGKLIPKQLFPILPVLGLVQAGYPTVAEQHLFETMSFEDFLVAKPENSFILKVSGDSMIKAGINPGDLVIIEKDKQPRFGDVVVANIDDGFTLKYFQRKQGRICLVPANDRYPVLFPNRN